MPGDDPAMLPTPPSPWVVHELLEICKRIEHAKDRDALLSRMDMMLNANGTDDPAAGQANLRVPSAAALVVLDNAPALTASDPTSEQLRARRSLVRDAATRPQTVPVELCATLRDTA